MPSGLRRNLAAVGVAPTVLELGLDATPRGLTEMVFHPFSGRMQVVERQIGVTPEPGLPEPMGTHDHLRLASPGGGQRRPADDAAPRAKPPPGEVLERGARSRRSAALSMARHTAARRSSRATRHAKRTRPATWATQPSSGASRAATTYSATSTTAITPPALVFQR